MRVFFFYSKSQLCGNDLYIRLDHDYLKLNAKDKL